MAIWDHPLNKEKVDESTRIFNPQTEIYKLQKRVTVLEEQLKEKGGNAPPSPI